MKEILINSTQMRYTEYWLPQTALTHEACEFITIYALYADGIMDIEFVPVYAQGFNVAVISF